MSFFVLLAALVLNHYRPLSRTDLLQAVFGPYANLLERNFNDGQARHGLVAWLLAILPPVLLIGAVYFVLYRLNILLGMLFAIAVLYVTPRFGRFSTPPEQIAALLHEGRLDDARERLRQWQSLDTHDYDAGQVARVSIESTLCQAHHDFIAPVFWFVLLGPAGAVLYRLAHLLRNVWGNKSGAFGDFSKRAFDWLDWLPARFTAGCFAVMGDFEDAVYCWRIQAFAWPDRAVGIMLASGSGALCVRLCAGIRR
ncbi:MAG TPA: regulatory signaling modulator protein AmpE [Methylophilaceae bacterium]|nr:regulatory signaling modulator protein AmpE [Methylophilaceae bacterium]